MRTIVIIPTFGRKGATSDVLRALERQTRLPDEVIVSAPDASHVEQFVSDKFPVRFTFGQAGLCRQRNAALEQAIGRSDVISFFDDDFIPARGYLAAVQAEFAAAEDVHVVSGHLLMDGIHGGGVPIAEALTVIAEDEAGPTPARETQRHVGAYGCNMSVRTAAIGANRFDERLVLYGWQEDIDFTSRVGRGGRVISVSTARGVHLGTKGGRVSGLRFGYSQVMNPAYLIRKGSMPFSFGFKLMARNIAANVARSLYPEPHVDRRGRLRGNVLATLDLFRGRIQPEQVLNL